jgi:hypothetical protein
LLWCISMQVQPPSASYLANLPQETAYTSSRNATPKDA